MQLRNLNNANTSSCVLVWPIAFSRERARKRLPMSISKGVSGCRPICLLLLHKTGTDFDFGEDPRGLTVIAATLAPALRAASVSSSCAP